MQVRLIIELTSDVTRMAADHPACSSLQEQLTSVQEQNTTERVLEHRSEAEALCCTSETRTDC